MHWSGFKASTAGWIYIKPTYKYQELLHRSSNVTGDASIRDDDLIIRPIDRGLRQGYLKEDL